MRKKIYDIKHPKSKSSKVSKKTDEKIKNFFDKTETKKIASVSTVSKAKNSDEKVTMRDKKMPVWRYVIISSVFVVFILCIYLFFKLPKADITIWPNLEEVSYEQAVVADTSVTSVDITKSVMPAEVFLIEKNETREFQATGNASNEGKSSGTITIFNKNDPPTPLTLRSGTRFISDSGYVFNSLASVTIPAAQKSGGKITPGSIQIKVEAAEGGDAYNIGASSFSVPGLKGNAYYFNIYASSDKDMSGGFAGEIRKITEGDINKAEDNLSEILIELAKEELKRNAGDDYIILDDVISYEIDLDSSKAKVGTVSKSFIVSGSVKANAVSFRKSDLDEFIKSALIYRLDEGKAISYDSIQENYSFAKIEEESGKLTINTDFSSKIYQDISKNSLGLSLFGQNEYQVNKTINNILGDSVSRTEVKFWPFWVSSVPNNQKAINIHINLE